MKTKFFTHAHWLRWRSYIIGIGGLAFVLIIYLFNLDKPALLGPQEYTFVRSNVSLQHILDNPMWAPFSLLQSGFMHVSHTLVAARLPAVIGAVAAVTLFYSLVHRWHGRRIAIMAAGLFAASGWLLHMGRLAEPQILLLLIPIVLLAFSSWLNTTKHPDWALILMALVYGSLLFIPGAIWFEVITLVLTRKVWWATIKTAKPSSRAGAGLILALCLFGLGYRLATSTELIKLWLGVLGSLPTPVQFLSQWAHSVTFLLVRGPYAPELWLAHPPIFTTFTAVMCLLGTYVYAKHFKNARAHLLTAYAIIGSLLAGINGVNGQSFLIPTVSLLAAAGIAYLLHEWYIIFPKNPLGHGFGTVAVGVAIFCVSGYNLAAYFIAWEQSPNTKTTFTRQL